MRLAALLLALCAALVLPACGEDDEGAAPGSGGDARALLERAFSTPIESGRIAADLAVDLEGVPALADGIELKLSGPFTDRRAALDVTVSASGRDLSGGLTVTEDNAYVSFQDQDYELGEKLFDELGGKDAAGSSLTRLGIEPEEWIEDPRVEGGEEVAGTATTRVTAEVDVRAIVDDVADVAKNVMPLGGAGPLELDDEDREQIDDVVQSSKIDLYVADDDHTLRRIVLEVEFDVPGEGGGAEGGRAKLDLTLSDVGEPQRIEPPANARPLDDLLSRLGLGAESFLQ